MVDTILTGSPVRTATCACGQLRIRCTGEPVRVSVCHCLNCQRRSGSAFAYQARWPNAQVEVSGRFHEHTRSDGDSGKPCTFRFCPDCGATISFAGEAMPGTVAVPVGGFADPSFLPPRVSIYEERKHAWVAVTGAGIDHID